MKISKARRLYHDVHVILAVKQFFAVSAMDVLGKRKKSDNGSYIVVLISGFPVGKSVLRHTVSLKIDKKRLFCWLLVDNW